jgi:hypothetical protein
VNTSCRSPVLRPTGATCATGHSAPRVAPANPCRHACRSSATFTFGLRVLGSLSVPPSCSLLSTHLRRRSRRCLVRPDPEAISCTDLRVRDMAQGLAVSSDLQQTFPKYLSTKKSSQSRLALIPDWHGVAPGFKQTLQIREDRLVYEKNMALVGSCINSLSVNYHGVGLTCSTRAPSQTTTC